MRGSKISKCKADFGKPGREGITCADMLTLLTAEDVHYGHQQALPPEMRTNGARASDWLRESEERRRTQTQ